MLITYFSSPSFFNSSPNKCDTYRDDDRHHKPNGKQRPDWNPERNENDCIFDNRMACDKKDKRQHHIFSHAMRLSKIRSEEHTSELQSRFDIVCRPLLDK